MLLAGIGHVDGQGVEADGGKACGLRPFGDAIAFFASGRRQEKFPGGRFQSPHQGTGVYLFLRP